jgi:hypothetical protein
MQRCAVQHSCRDRDIACRLEESKIGHTVFTRGGLPEQVCEGSVVLVFETGHSRRNFCGRQLHNHTALDRLCGSPSCAACEPVSSPRFFPWRQTFDQRAALSVDRPNAAHNAYQQQLHRWDRGPRKFASASVHASSLQQSTTSPLPRMFNFGHFR